MRPTHAALSDLTEVRPARGTRWVALRASLAILTPLLILLGTDHITWGLYATFGAFTAVYGGPVPYTGRWRRQLAGGLVMVGATVTGAAVSLSPERAWLALPATAVWAALAAALSDRHRWIPPGPLFAVFAVGACSARPSVPSDLLAAVLIASGTAAFALTLGRLEEWLRAVPREEHHGRHALPLDADRYTLHVTRVAIAVVISGAIATWLGIGHPYWAMVGAVVPLSVPRLRAQTVRGAQRLLGTLIGLGVAWVILSIGVSPLAAVLLAAALQACAELLVVRNYAYALIVITPLALLMGHLAHPEPVNDLVLDRLVESVLGVAIGLIVAWLTRERERD